MNLKLNHLVKNLFFFFEIGGCTLACSKDRTLLTVVLFLACSKATTPLLLGSKSYSAPKNTQYLLYSSSDTTLLPVQQTQCHQFPSLSTPEDIFAYAFVMAESYDDVVRHDSMIWSSRLALFRRLTSSLVRAGIEHCFRAEK